MVWIPQAELQTGKQLKRLHSDNGGEFFSNEFSKWLGLRGVVQQSTPSCSPQSNGIAERMNMTLQDKARTIMLESKLPGSLWGEILICAAQLDAYLLSFSHAPLDVDGGEAISGAPAGSGL